MSEKFEFRGCPLCLSLCGSMFCIDLDDKTASCCKSILAEAQRRLKALKNGQETETVSENGLCRFFEESIDELLGVGTTKMIFKERQLNLSDLSDLLCYIVSRIKKAFDDFGRSA